MKIVLAYSGGLDTSVLLTWLQERHNAEMIAFCADIGQGEELRGLKQKAKRTGASKSSDYSVGIYFANAVISHISYIQVTF